jgi:hypothetical protein
MCRASLRGCRVRLRVLGRNTTEAKSLARWVGRSGGVEGFPLCMWCDNLGVIWRPFGGGLAPAVIRGVQINAECVQGNPESTRPSPVRSVRVDLCLYVV